MFVPGRSLKVCKIGVCNGECRNKSHLFCGKSGRSSIVHSFTYPRWPDFLQSIDMAPSEIAKKTVSKSKPKKEKVFHPESRKADQLARAQLKKSKVAAANSKRQKRFAREGKIESISQYILLISLFSRCLQFLLSCFT